MSRPSRERSGSCRTVQTLRRSRIFAPLFCLLLTSCDWMPGYPDEANRWKPASAVTDFTTLYRENCLACHSDGTTTSASIPMNFPRYLHLVPVERLRGAIASGIPNTTMPGFAGSAGGPLTDGQIDALVAGILAWETASTLETLPPYTAPLGNLAAGQTAYQIHCATCHKPGDTLLSSAYLGLVSDQYLRTVTIVGRPELGMEPTDLTDPEVADIVAFMASHRTPQTSLKSSSAGGAGPSNPSGAGALLSPTPAPTE